MLSTRRGTPSLLALLAVIAALAVGCAGSSSDEARRVQPVVPTSGTSDDLGTSPYLVALGTAQDGGFPHAGCACVHCQAARRDPSRQRLIASLAVVLPEPRRVFLVDATPDIRRQLDMLRPADAPAETDRSPVDGIFLTHAHIGHYLGLAFLGFEAIDSRGIPVHCSSELAEFLRGNGPWSQLVRLQNILLFESETGEAIDLGQGVSLTPIAVPHRDEYTDTVGFVIRGPRRSVLYVPDTDAWDAWDPPLLERLESIQVAIVDGTFFAADELPGRDVSTIGHPLMLDTMDRLEPRVREGSLEVYFTHLNHSNAALDENGETRGRIEARGFAVLADGQRLPI